MKTEHIELPWFIEENDGIIYILNKGDVCPQGIVAFETKGVGVNYSETLANAQFIVRAANSHNELLEVLNDLMTMRSKCFIPNDGDWWDKKARAAIDKATRKI